ncbi:MAG: hypothetical protein C4560_06705, partial [Nitrospiraceae bacterium]
MNLQDEKKLLLLCARPRTTDKERKELIHHLVKTKPDWEKVADLAASQGTAPLLYFNLKDIKGYAPVPGDVMDKLKSAYLGNAARNMYLYSKLQKVVRALDEHGVDVMVLKGAALAGTVYPDIGLRTMADIDLLVKHEHLDRVRDIMSGLDYEAQTEAGPEEWYRKKHFHLPVYLHKEKSTAIEIHWHITQDPEGIDIGKWWERAGKAELHGVRALIPSPEDMVFHLCLHLHQESTIEKAALRGLCDIAGTLRYYEKEIDWTLFCEEVSRCNIARQVYAVLFLVKKHLHGDDLSLPRLKPEMGDGKFTALLEQLMLGPETVSYGPFLRFLTARTFWKKAHILFTALFPSREEMSGRYGASPCSLKTHYHYLSRPVELFAKYR